MKIVDWVTLVDRGFSTTSEFHIVTNHVRQAIQAVVWPPGSHKFILNPSTGRGRGEGNGVTPIKNAFVTSLVSEGWATEVQTFDAHYRFPSDTFKPFVVEWETGNISSSHRAINRIAKGMLEEEVSGGLLVVPSRPLYRFLTDRVGNSAEVAPYYDLWRRWQELTEFLYLAVVVVEHDGTDPNVPRIAKGTDGRAML